MEEVSTNTDEVASDAEKIVELQNFGDKELWYAEGKEESWRFPLWVEWKRNPLDGKEYGSVTTAVAPYYKQWLILRALFELHDFLGRGNKWLIRKEMVPALLQKAPGITPTQYYLWPGEQAQPIEYTKATMPDARQPRRLKGNLAHEPLLVKTIVEHCGLQSSIVKIVLDGLAKAGPDLLIKHRVPMDLGFVKLVAVPFRANWKEIVCLKLRRRKLLKSLRQETNEETKATTIPEVLCSPHNIALRRAAHVRNIRVDYTIEAVPSKFFEGEAGQHDWGQHQTGNTAYVRKYEKTVEKLYDEILEILRSYLKKVGLAFARVSESSDTGGLRFVPTLGLKAKAHGVNFRRLPVHIVPSVLGFSALAEESDSNALYLPVTKVPKVPALSSSSADLRQRKEPRSLEEFLDGGYRDNGVPLPNALEGATSWQPVFPGVTTGIEPSGLDAEGDRP